MGFAASIRGGSFGFRNGHSALLRTQEHFAVIFAGPIAVIIFVAVNKLYVRDSLSERTVLPGEDAK